MKIAGFTILEPGASFSMKRLYMLLKIRVIEDAPAVLLAAAGALAVNLLAVAVLGYALFGGSTQNNDTWGAIIALGGILLASRAFAQLHSGRSAIDAVLLPASNQEKYVATLAMYLIVYPIAASILAFLASAISSGMEALAGNGFGPLWHPFRADIWRTWAEYAVATVFFVMGSAAFKKLALLKTILAAIACYLVPAALLFFVITSRYRGNGQDAPGISYMNGILRIGDGDSSTYALSGTLRWITDIYRYAILPALALVFGYRKMSKKEIADEVQ
ncbi:MAG: hypothetical protein WAZ99_04010 [Rectinemataceae bacterium]